MRALIAKITLGLLLMAGGLWFAFIQSRVHEHLADGTWETHFDHTALYIGVGVALFGALMVTPGTVSEAVKDAKVLVGRRLSGQAQPPEEH